MPMQLKDLHAWMCMQAQKTHPISLGELLLDWSSLLIDTAVKFYAFVTSFKYRQTAFVPKLTPTLSRCDCSSVFSPSRSSFALSWTGIYHHRSARGSFGSLKVYQVL